MTLSIGKEKVGDGTEIIEMLIKAFEDIEYSDKKEHELVKALRKSGIMFRTIYSSKSR